MHIVHITVIHPRDVLTMYLLRIGEVSVAEFTWNFRQMLPDQLNLFAIARVFNNNLLYSAGFGFVKYMLGLFKVERHDMHSALGDFIQALRAGGFLRQCSMGECQA